MKSFRNRMLALATVAIVAIYVSAIPSFAQTATVERGKVVQISDLQPFTHTAYIPLGADLSSIRIENIKRVKLATKLRTVTNPEDCIDRGADGITPDCSRTTYESRVPAFQVTYSYRDQSTVTDEYGTAWFTFSVYFREDEIGPGLRRALSRGKINRSAAAELFEFSTARGSIQQDVVDEANSTLCDRYYGDSGWVQTNPRCEDSVTYTKVTSPSPYVTVKVDPVPAPVETALAGRAMTKLDSVAEPAIR